MLNENLTVELKIDKGCVLIAEAGHHFCTTDITTAKAMLIYHHYQKVRNEYSTNFHLFATASFSLSAEICQEDLKFEKIVVYFNSLGEWGDSIKDEQSKDLLLARLMEVQYDISHVVFKFPYKIASSRSSYTPPNIDVAHKFVFAYLDKFANFLEFKEYISDVKIMSLKLLNTFYHTQKCVSYTPLQIAWAAMHLSCLKDCIEIEENKCWQKELFACIPDTKIFHKVVNDMSLITEVATRECNHNEAF
ncbi:hypothetical protein JTE90_011493 [Oedothorax gibbosus]|uniref:Cyclin C-terminal domain-containing protein n=1 Tax=Oedothorax gibbosus TaxID=931172 RepID=A0AAV6VD43_9ARAC|nr:hypothetical protein JTE90_011493 [Oedothorax gibbosus]